MFLRFVSVAFACAIAASSLGCESRVALGTRCSVATDCPGLVCVAGRCGDSCTTSQTCTGGARCLRDPISGVGSCSLAVDSCSAGTCAEGLRCLEGQCVNLCSAASDCPDGLCTASTCVPVLAGSDAGVSDDAPAPSMDSPIDSPVADDANEDAGSPTCPSLPRGERITDVALGDQAGCARTESGLVWCWGYWPGLIDATTEHIAATPFLVLADGGTPLRVVDLVVGSAYGCGREGVAPTDGVVCWGDVGGQGDVWPEARRVRLRTALTPLLGASAIAGGRHHVCALVGTEVFCWGRGESSGALGDGTTDTRAEAARATELGSDVRAIAAGYRRTIARIGDGTLRGVGDDDQGELGGDAPSPAPGYSATAVVSPNTPNHSLVLPLDGACYLDASGAPFCWGSGATLAERVAMELLPACDGTCTTRPLPLEVAGGVALEGLATGWDGYTMLGFTSDGVIYGWGSNEGKVLMDDPTINVFFRVNPILHATFRTHRIAVGAVAACAIEDGTGELRCWGQNRHGQLGRGEVTLEDEPTPTSPCWPE